MKSVQVAEVDLHEYLLEGATNAFVMKVVGDRMSAAGIEDGDLLIVDRQKKPGQNSIVVVELEEGLFVRRMRDGDTSILLTTESEECETIELFAQSKFDIWGVVTKLVRDLDARSPTI